MVKIAFLFPGQGSQAVGMGKSFHDASPAAKAVFQEANDALGFDLTKLIFEGPEADLTLTANTQPAVLTASVAAARVCAERGLTPSFAAGHSLGEYSALVTAGALRFADAVRVVRKRGEFMQEAVPVGTGAMAAIMGLDLAAVEAICTEAAQGEVVDVANINSAGQTVVAGHKGAVERAVALAGKKSVMLPVSAPFHSSLLAPAGERLAGELAAVAVSDPAFPVVRNFDAGVTTVAADVKPFLVKQVASPVRWTECVQRLAGEGATAFVEVGPGRVLSGLLRRILEGARGQSVEDVAGLDKAIAAVGASA